MSSRRTVAYRLIFIASLAAALAAIAASGCGGTSTSTTTTPTLTTPSGGTSFGDAIKVGSIGEERDIMNKYACGSGGHYRLVHVDVAEKDGQHYDIVDAVCSLGPERRQFYFDVSSCFPCPD